MKVLGVVPARGGSKRAPGKNIADLGGRPLLCWTLETARQSNLFDCVVVTSDDDDILNTAKAYWPWVTLHKRSPLLARDDTPMLPVVQDVYHNYPAEVVVTLQPTSPFRTSEDLLNAYEMLRDSGGDSVFSVTEAPDDLVFQVQHANRLRQLPNIVVPNGALFLITGEALDQGLDWFDGVAYGYRMPKDRSIDIDTALDLEIARMIVEKS